MSDRHMLVAGGQPQATIMWWSGEASPVPPFAAGEHQAYLAKLSGATLPIRPAPFAAPAPPAHLPSMIALVPDTVSDAGAASLAWGRSRGAWPP